MGCVDYVCGVVYYCVKVLDGDKVVVVFGN